MSSAAGMRVGWPQGLVDAGREHTVALVVGRWWWGLGDYRWPGHLGHPLMLQLGRSSGGLRGALGSREILCAPSSPSLNVDTQHGLGLEHAEPRES